MGKTPGLPLLFLVAALLSSCYNPFYDAILGRRRGRNREGAGAQPLAAVGVITDLTAVRDSPVTFTWIDPEGDFDHIEIWYSTSDSDKSGTFVAQVPKGTQTCTVDGAPDVPLYFHFITVDKAGKRSAVVNYLVPLTVPVQLTNLTGKVNGGDSVTLSWTNPAATAFDHIEIEINPNPGGTTPRKVKKGEGEQSYTWAGLSNGTEYTFIVKTFDKDGKITTAEVTVTLAADETPPGPVTNLAAVDGGFGSVPLKWKNPFDADLQYVEITCEPSAGKARTVNAAPSANGTYTWAGLAGGVTYTFTLKAVDHSGNRSTPTSVSGAPLDLTPPAAVTNLTALAGSGCVLLFWTDPADADLDYIQIECNEIAGTPKAAYPGDQTYTWYHGEFWDEVLTNDTAYTFTVTTRDANGNLGAAVTIGSSPHEGTLKQRIDAAKSGDTITLYTNEAVPAAIGINKTITLTGYDDTERTLSIVQNGSMFNVNAGGSLTLDNKVTLKGKSDNNASLVKANSGGELVMESGSKLSGNTAADDGGVYVGSGAEFTMNGGEISGNMTSHSGGVAVWGGTFTMTAGGKISGNTALGGNGGGGVFVMNGAAFTMSGGEISGNKSPNGNGGGVSVYHTGTFNKESGGIIYGSDGGVLKNTSGNNIGHAVYVSSGPKKRNSTTGAGVTLNSGTAGAAGGWD
jgi:hypothetical protein